MNLERRINRIVCKSNDKINNSNRSIFLPSKSLIQTISLVGLFSFLEASPTLSEEYKLMQYVQSDGKTLMFGNSLRTFLEQGGDSDFIEDMLSIKDEEGNSIYHDIPFAYYLADGGTYEYAKELSEMVNKSGERIFNFSDVYSLNSSGCSLDYINGLLSIKDKNGRSILQNDIERYERDGGSVEFAEEIFSYYNDSGDFLFSPSFLLRLNHFSKEKGEDIVLNYVKELSGLRNKDGNKIFSGWDIINLIIADVSLDEAKAVYKLKGEDEERTFSVFDYTRFKKFGGSLNELEDILNIVDHEGNPIISGHLISMFKDFNYSVDNLKEIAELKDFQDKTIFVENSTLTLMGLDNILNDQLVIYAKELRKITDHEGESIFSGEDILWVYDSEEFLTFAKKFSKLKNSNGEILFNARELRSYFNIDGDFDYARRLSNYQNSEDKPIFSGEDIVYSYLSEVPFSYVESLIVRSDEFMDLNGKIIYRYYQLGLTEEDIFSYSDTEKPNAVVIFPINDYNKAFESDGEAELFEMIKENYDVWVKIVSQEDEVYDAISYVPNIELLILGGHGTQTTLSLGEDDLRLKESTKNETYTIDIQDLELKDYLPMLNSDAVIFLNSCSNAEGGREKNNLANFITEMSNGRKVIAAKEPFSTGNIDVISIYPFDVNLGYSFFFDQSKEITYKSGSF